MTDLYTRSLEIRCEELQTMISKMQTDYQPNIYNALKLLIERKRQMLTTNQLCEYAAGMSSAIFLKEFLTIEINAGRQIGHTTALHKLLMENRSSSVLIMFHKHQLRLYPEASHLDTMKLGMSHRTLILADGFTEAKPEYKQRLFEYAIRNILPNKPQPILVIT